MSNLQTATLAIEAELKHAREGLAYYQSRVEALEAALSKLDSVEIPARKQAGGRRSSRTRSAAKGQDNPASKAKPGGEGGLPRTGLDFWPGLIGEKPLSAADILAAAVKSLGITPTGEQSKKLAQRQANALSILTRKGVITSSGAGRARRFFRSA